MGVKREILALLRKVLDSALRPSDLGADDAAPRGELPITKAQHHRRAEDVMWFRRPIRVNARAKNYGVQLHGFCTYTAAFIVAARFFIHLVRPMNHIFE